MKDKAGILDRIKNEKSEIVMSVSDWYGPNLELTTHLTPLQNNKGEIIGAIGLQTDPEQAHKCLTNYQQQNSNFVSDITGVYD
jgi:hypothetical protein